MLERHEVSIKAGLEWRPRPVIDNNGAMGRRDVFREKLTGIGDNCPSTRPAVDKLRVVPELSPVFRTHRNHPKNSSKNGP